VLARIAGLFARRGFNIYSLAVAPAESHARFSRVTIVVDAESAPLEQIVGQLDKLVNVVAISDLSPRDAVERELLLATLPLDDGHRSAMLDTITKAGASIVDVSSTSGDGDAGGDPGRVRRTRTGPRGLRRGRAPSDRSRGTP